jgi:6-phosphogluconate dehydrogenase
MSMVGAQVAVIGLAAMGKNFARNLTRHGLTVAIHDRVPALGASLVAEYGAEGFVDCATLEDVVAALVRPRVVIILVPAGTATDAVIDPLTALMEPGDVIVDAGNAHFEDTRRREEALRHAGLLFVGTGVSGGEEGALNGPSFMVGGSAEAYEAVRPLLESVAARVDGVPCCAHVGPDGAGHYVKTVHNGIEYAVLQLIGEAYHLLRSGLGASPGDLAGVFGGWNEGEYASYLLGITAEVLRQEDAKTGRPLVDVILDEAGQKGTGCWAVQSALDLGVPTTGAAEAAFARAVSTGRDRREAVRASLGALEGGPKAASRDEAIEDVRQALQAATLTAYAQGFDQILAASGEFGWGIDVAVVARIWRGGCIIRAGFLDRIAVAYSREPALASLLAEPGFAAEVAAAVPAWRRVVSGAALSGIPAPALASLLSYLDALRTERLSAALTQAQRDFFGSHTYRRIDVDGSFHTRWSSDRSETEA